MQAKSRRPAREAALRALYQIEIGKASLEDAVSDMRENAAFEETLVAYAEALVRGIVAHASELKESIVSRLKDWDFARLAAIDRVLLEIGAYELIFVPDVPPVVTLNEAIEVAKKYSTAESGKFVNGILAKIWEDNPKSGEAPSMEMEETASKAAAEPPEREEALDSDSPEWQALSKTGAVIPVKKEGEL
jgi:transcription antitermination factor NusB